MLVPDSFWHSDLLSVQMRMLVWGAQCSLIHSVANSIAHASSSYEHVSLRPRCMILSTVIGFFSVADGYHCCCTSFQTAAAGGPICVYVVVACQIPNTLNGGFAF